MNEFLVLEFKAVLKGSINNLIDSLFIVNQDLVVDANLIEKRSSSHSFVEMRDNIINIVHEEMFSFHIVEAKKGKILINGEEQPAVDLGQLVMLYNLYVGNQGLINSLCHIQLLEKSVVFLPLVIEVIDDRLVEHFLFYMHQRFNVLKTNSVL